MSAVVFLRRETHGSCATTDESAGNVDGDCRSDRYRDPCGVRRERDEHPGTGGDGGINEQRERGHDSDKSADHRSE
jgi:hypothetical protein